MLGLGLGRRGRTCTEFEVQGGEAEHPQKCSVCTVDSNGDGALTGDVDVAIMGSTQTVLSLDPSME